MFDQLLKRSTRTGHGERGAEAVELAIALPVFVAILFGCIDVGRLCAGYSAVRAAVVVGTREAVGLQRPEWQAVNTIMGNSTDQEVPIGTFVTRAKTAYPEFVDSAANSTQTNWYQTQADTNGITSLYRLEVRAIAYATRVLSQSTGNMSYPCNDRESCVHCFTLRGNANYYQKYFSVDVGNAQRTWVANMLGLECTYNVPITTASVALGILPQFVPVTARVYVPINNYAAVLYDPSKQ
ncbi:MAG: TadE family protein [Bdellovibrionota bacterium]